MSMTRTVSKDGLKVQPRESAGVCEYCEHTFRAGELSWVCEDWVTAKGLRGHTTATLCPACSELALWHCWACGRLTGRGDQCALCSLRAEIS